MFRRIIPLNNVIINRARELAVDINNYNTKVLTTFLKLEFNREDNEVKLLRQHKDRIILMLGKLKREVLQEAVLLDIENLNKKF